MSDFPQLNEDAPPVPKGLRPRRGVEYGCGMAECGDCYEMNSNDDRDEAYERAAARARSNDFEDTDGKDWT